MKKKPKIGAHISVAGGIKRGLERARKMEVECMQIFSGTPRRYAILFPKNEELTLYKESIGEMEDFPVYVHANYLLNLVPEEKSIRNNSIKSLKETFEFASLINARGVVYHPGSPKGGDKEAAIKREIEGVKKVLQEAPSDILLLIENTAGKRKIGVTPAEVGHIIKGVGGGNVGACIDTAHSFASGNIINFKKENIEKWMNSWKKEVGLSNIKLLHANDSRSDHNSQSDRHENTGEGHIGKEGFLNLMLHEVLKSVPWITEAPGFDKKGPDKKNVDILKGIREGI